MRCWLGLPRDVPWDFSISRGESVFPFFPGILVAEVSGGRDFLEGRASGERSTKRECPLLLLGPALEVPVDPSPVSDAPLWHSVTTSQARDSSSRDPSPLEGPDERPPLSRETFFPLLSRNNGSCVAEIDGPFLRLGGIRDPSVAGPFQ